MSASIAPPRAGVISEERTPRPRMAKADLRKAETEAHRREVGRIVERVQKLSGLNLQEFAAAIKRDERQVKRWFTGEERPQLDAIRAVEQFRPLFLVAFAEDAGAAVELTTQIVVRRSA